MVQTRSEAGKLQEDELCRIEEERIRRQTRQPPASPSMPAGEEAAAHGSGLITALAPERATSPAPSNHSQRTTNSTLQVRLAELEAAERLAAIKRRELEIEADLIKKRLAAQIAAAEAEGSTRDVPTTNREEQHQRVDEWLRLGAAERGERREPSRPIVL